MLKTAIIKQFFNNLKSKLFLKTPNISNKFILKNSSIYTKFTEHFKLANQGKEDIIIILWFWGGCAYLIAFLVSKIIAGSSLAFVKFLLGLPIMAYFIWHIWVIKKCSPKKPTLTKEEKEQLKQQRFKRLMRKLFLKEPITKWNPSLIGMLIDVYVILCFLTYLIR